MKIKIKLGHLIIEDRKDATHPGVNIYIHNGTCKQLITVVEQVQTIVGTAMEVLPYELGNDEPTTRTLIY